MPNICERCPDEDTEKCRTCRKVENKVDAVKNNVRKLVDKELGFANNIFPLFRSDHEGVSIAREEMEEADEAMIFVKDRLSRMWELVKQNKDATEEARYLKEFAINLSTEAIQCAAMAQKFIDSRKTRERTDE